MAKAKQLSAAYNIEIDAEAFNEVYLEYLYSVTRYEVYYGGAGSGKSTFVGQKLALQLSLMEGRNLMCLRKQAVDVRDSCYAEIYNSLAQFGLLDMWHIVEHPHVRMTNSVNGNMILFNGVDDIENVKSIKFKNKIGGKEKRGNLTDVWYEEASEELQANTIKELDRRLRDRFMQCRIILTFNPILVTHWLKGWMEDKVRRGKDIITLKTNHRDNKFLPEDYRQMLEDYQYTDPYAYKVYCLGEWGTMGQTVFNAAKLDKRMETLVQNETRVAETAAFSFDLDDNHQPIAKTMLYYHTQDGETTIYRFPEKNTPYVIGFDTAGEGSDYYAAQVVNNITKEQVAVYHSTQGSVHCIVQIYALGIFYNYALLCPETNFDSYPLEKLKEWRYPLIYQRNKPMDDYSDGVEQKLGFRTTSANRPRILSKLVEHVNNNTHLINDLATIDECLSFVRLGVKQNGMYWGAEGGAHDDLVLSLAITMEVSPQQSEEAIPDKTEITGFWFPEQLASGLNGGQLDPDTVDDYVNLKKMEFSPFAEAYERLDKHAR